MKGTERTEFRGTNRPFVGDFIAEAPFVQSQMWGQGSARRITLAVTSGR